MKVEAAETPLAEVDADHVGVFLFDGEALPADLADARGAADAEGGFRKSALIHPERPERVVVIGLGKRDDFTPERARVGAAIAVQAAAKRKATSLALLVPDQGDEAIAAAALVEGAILASYRFDRYKSKPGDGDEGAKARPKLGSLTVLGAAGAAAAVEAARASSEAANRARELQNLPSNLATPAYLAERALELAVEHDSLTCEVMERDEMVERGMGGLEAVSAGTDAPPKLITIRHEGPGELIAIVGKGVTFDSGGISIKPSGGMQEMKMDMSGAAAVIETMGAVAELGLDANVLAVVPATENMPSGHAVKPGDIITQLNGKTVEVNNTDAEGRLILADALAYAVELGAERLVDFATLTGAVVVALGSTYAAVISNDDGLAAQVAEAGERTGELAWRLPLHEEYKKLTKGTVADLTNAASKRKAGTIYAGSFLEEFVDGRPWAHVDIAGTAWDTGRAYVGKGPTGFGVRLLVELLR
ncbi:leucyl aminopeptidase [soil metagenome]